MVPSINLKRAFLTPDATPDLNERAAVTYFSPSREEEKDKQLKYFFSLFFNLLPFVPKRKRQFSRPRDSGSSRQQFSPVLSSFLTSRQLLCHLSTRGAGGARGPWTSDEAAQLLARARRVGREVWGVGGKGGRAGRRRSGGGGRVGGGGELRLLSLARALELLICEI